MSENKFDLQFDTKKFVKSMSEYAQQHPDILKKAIGKAGVQLLNWATLGSPNLPLRAPVLRGILIGSGSVHVGGKHIASFSQGTGTPNTGTTRLREKEFTLTIAYNTIYAEKLHNGEWSPGPVSVQAGNVGNKWLEEHMRADRIDTMKLVATFYAEGISGI